MLPPTTPEPTDETPLTSAEDDLITEPVPAGPLTPIAEIVARPDFPQCALGLSVDMVGFTGVVTEIVRHSVKVRSPEGVTRSFNVFRLKALHGPALRSESTETASSPETAKQRPEPVEESDETEPEAPEREVIVEPDFDAPIQPITTLAGRPDFPQCAFGAHLDVVGYTGVVVEIVKQSLKVRSVEGDLRSYNVAVLRKLYGKG